MCSLFSLVQELLVIFETFCRRLEFWMVRDLSHVSYACYHTRNSFSMNFVFGLKYVNNSLSWFVKQFSFFNVILCSSNLFLLLDFLLRFDLNTLCSFFASSSLISPDCIFVKSYIPSLKLSNLFLAALSLKWYINSLVNSFISSNLYLISSSNILL